MIESQSSDTRLREPWLTVARVAWLAFFALAALVLLVAIPARWVELTQPTPTTLANLNALGWSVVPYAIYSIVTEVIFIAVFLIVGLIIFARRSDDWMALFIALTLVAFGVGNQTIVPTIGALRLYPFGNFVFACGGFAAWATFTQFPFLFPNGRYVPRWSRIPALLWFVLCIPWNFAVGTPFDPTTWHPWLFVPLLLFQWVSFAVSQVYRYRRVSNPIERQQTKWVVYALGMIVAWLLLEVLGVSLYDPTAFAYLFDFEPPTPQALAMMTALQSTDQLAFLLLPFAFAFSIFRYRLWDVDIVIKRTVQYGVLTALGFIVYLLAVSATSLLFQTQSNVVALLIVVVLIVVFARPALRRMNALADRYLPLPARPVEEAKPIALKPETIEEAKPIAPKSETTDGTATTTLREPWLTVARAIWILSTILAIIAFIGGAINLWNTALPSCTTPNVVCGPWEISREDMALAQQLGFSPQLLSLVSLASLLLTRAAFLIVGFIIFVRRSDDWVALTLSLMLTLFVTEGVQNLGAFMPVVNVLYVGATILFYVLPFIFPDGRFVPRWTKRFFPWLLVLSLPTIFIPMLGIAIEETLYSGLIIVAFLLWFLTAGYAAIYRYRRVSDTSARQQTKWVMLGILGSFIMIIPFTIAALVFPPSQPSPERLAFVYLVSIPIGTLVYLFVAGGIAFAVFRYRLYAVDFIIRRTIIYGGLVGGLAVAYFGGIALLQFLSQAITGPQSNIVVVLITLTITAMFNPVRRRFQTLIDRAFYREQVDFREAFTAFAREVRTIIDLQELLRTLVTRTTDLFHVTHGAVFLTSADPSGLSNPKGLQGRWRLAEARNVPPDVTALNLSDEVQAQLHEGRTVSHPKDKHFQLLIPLIAPTTQPSVASSQSSVASSQPPTSNLQSPLTNSLIGVLALGPRLSEQPYSREDQTLLMSLADQAGTALYVAQLIQEKEAEAARREATERQLEAHRNSPIGRAEALAEKILAQPETALGELHALTQKAGQDPDTADLLDPLPRVMANLTTVIASSQSVIASEAKQSPSHGEEIASSQKTRLAMTSGLADGYRYIFSSQLAPELLPVGLRTLIDHLAADDAATADAHAVYHVCLQALEANSVVQIANCELVLSEVEGLRVMDSTTDKRMGTDGGSTTDRVTDKRMGTDGDSTTDVATDKRMETDGGSTTDEITDKRMGTDADSTTDRVTDKRMGTDADSTTDRVTDKRRGTKKSADLTNQSPISNLQSPFLHDLTRALAELHHTVEALRAYERVETSQDQLAYLASAIERLGHADRFARAELGSADRPIIQRIVSNWLSVVTGAMSELQTRARIVCQLLTRHTWQGDIITLALGVRNEGRGAALNVRVSLAPASEYSIVDEVAQVARLASGEEAQIELRVRPRIATNITHITTGRESFRARFVVLYNDPRGSDQVENFADVVYLLAAEGPFQFIPNPYVVGTPLQTGSPLFFGRSDVIAFIQENLAAAHRNNLVLIGQRRTGKTSLLKQLPSRLGDNYLSVYLDGQSLALDPGLPNFFYSLATEIAFALDDKGLAIEPPDLSDFTNSPTSSFERKFLATVRAAIGERHLLLLLDEFEELEASVRRGNLEPSVFAFLRHLIQHQQNLSVIFCGTHRMEELAADYWSVLFNISLYKHVAFLGNDEALRLIQEPVSTYNMRYDDLALDKMWRVTAGHPYFLQLLCHSLVNQHNKTQRNYVTVGDVNAALDEILASGEAHFVYLWTESTRDERLVLTALSRMMPLTGQATPVQVTDYLNERGIALTRRTVGEAMHHLALRDILRSQKDDGADLTIGDVYRWQLGLLGLWVEKYKSLSRVVDEGI